MALATFFSGLPTVTGIELVWQATGDWQAGLCQLRRAGATITLAQHKSPLLDLAGLKEALGSETTPVALVLAGRGLLFRTLPTTNPDQRTLDAGQFATLLPGSNPADFYCQCVVGPELTQVALVRRQPVDELVAAWRAAGLWIVDLSLGPQRFADLLPYLKELPTIPELPVGPFRLTLSPDHTAIDTFAFQPGVEVATEPVAYRVGEEVLSSAQVLPYAAALRVLAGEHTLELATLRIPAVEQLRVEWGQRHLFHILRLALPLVALALLVANLLVGQHLLIQQDQLAVTIGGNQQLLSRVRAVQQASQRQQAFLTATGWTQPSVNSICADRLAASLPPGIQLLTADISPLLQGNGEPGHRISFRQEVVVVRGQCRNAQQFNTWLQQLTKLPWVRAVRDQNFAYEYSGGLGTFTFTLLLNPAAFRS